MNRTAKYISRLEVQKTIHSRVKYNITNMGKT